MDNEINIWEGIYSSIQDAASHARRLRTFMRTSTTPHGNSFDQERWVQHQIKEAEQLQQESNRPCAGGGILRKVLAGHVVGHNKPLSVIDFGGGLALEFLRLQAAGFPTQNMNFCVIETPAICRTGRDFYRTEPGVHFRSTLPRDARRGAIFHAANSLHYVINWKGLLTRVSRLQPELIVLAGVTAGPIPTFGSLQCYYGSWLPVWFWNQNEFVSFVEGLGYECVLRREAEARYFGQVRDLPMSNFPRTHRLRRKCDLVFSRRLCRPR